MYLKIVGRQPPLPVRQPYSGQILKIKIELEVIILENQNSFLEKSRLVSPQNIRTISIMLILK